MNNTMNNYRERDGLRFHLEQRYQEKPQEFPSSVVDDYARNFLQIETYLNDNVHLEVGMGAALKGNGLLNDHGKKHVSMVIERAGMLIGSNIDYLTGYEIYLLLLAIHFHDVGNIGGREEHEKRIFEVMEALGPLLSLETPVKKHIALIAMAHGGKINGTKDTISSLNFGDHLQGKLIRPALLAAILRFSDEIADDLTRASRFLYDVDSVPLKNQIFHRYSKCLQPVGIEGDTLILKFDLPLDYAVKTSSKENKKTSRGYSQVFLYDEILHRSKKCLCELEYCSRYFRELIRLTSIRADIVVHKPRELHPVYDDSILFRLSGYPNTTTKDISTLVQNPPRAANGRELRRFVIKETNDA